MRAMDATIHKVKPHSIADALGLVAGEQIVALQGRHDLEDLFDYQEVVLDCEEVELHVRHLDGTEEIFEIEKDPDEDLGIIFTSPVFTPIKTCNNACPFCFIDQQPDGLRPTLYVKDDDYRLSYFNSTYITLTNLTERDRQRIEQRRPGPLYVSVHATTPEVRQILLANPKGGDIMDKLQWLKSLEIPFHCQIVVCPGINDGDILTRSLEDLATLCPEALSVAIVPVGLTQYRGTLTELRPVDGQTAMDVIDRVETFLEKRPDLREVIFLSDEFYFKAGRPLPQYTSYGDFPQLDDGVGTARLLQQTFWEAEESLPAAHPHYQATGEQTNLLIITGSLAAMVLMPIIQRLNAIDGLFIDVKTVDSTFWGNGVSVAGLITGQDILDACRQDDLSGYAYGLIPSIMLRHGNSVFLDDRSVEDISNTLDLPLRVIQDPYSGTELIEQVLINAPAASSLATTTPTERWVR